MQDGHSGPGALWGASGGHCGQTERIFIAFAQMAAEEPTMHPPQYKAREGGRGRGDVSPDKTCCQNSSPVAKTHRQCEIQRSNRASPTQAGSAARRKRRGHQKFGDTRTLQENNLQLRSKFSRFRPLVVVAGVLTSCLDFNAMAQEVPPPYVELGYAPRFYLGAEDTQLGWAHLVSGNYGLAEQHYRRAVEATRQNGSAWIGLAASYDRLGRFDLADLAYRRALRLEGGNYVILNNWGYSHLLRGDYRAARRLLERAELLAPGDPTIANNIAVLDAGLAHFHGWGP
jgi:Flp pilus assembly protein TadD